MQPGDTVVQAAGYSSTYGGNFIASLLALESELEGRGVRQVYVFPEAAAARDWCRRLVADGRTVYHTPDNARLSCLTEALRSIARKEDAGILHSHFNYYDISGARAVGMKLSSGKRPRLIWHYHSDFPVIRTPLRVMKNIVKYRVLGRRAVVVAVSDHLRQMVIREGFAPRRALTVENAIDIDRVVRQDASDDASADLGLPAGIPIILMFGWSPSVKGVDTAIAAVGSLLSSGEKLILAVVGGENEETKRAISEHCEESWLPMIRLLPPTNDVSRYYRIASVFLSASRSEGFPYSVCEAASSGLPIVASDLPGLRWLHESEGALFFASGDSVSLARCITQVINWSPAERDARTAQNVALVKAKFDIRDWAQRIIDVYSMQAS